MPEQITLLERIASAAELLGFWPEVRNEAMRTIERAVATDDRDVASQAWVYAARASSHLGDDDGAAKAWRASIEAHPNPVSGFMAEAHANLAQVLLEQDDVDGALGHFELADRASPTPLVRARVGAMRADVLERLSHLRSAWDLRTEHVRFLRAEAASGSAFGIALAKLARSTAALGDLEEAMSLYDEADQHLMPRDWVASGLRLDADVDGVSWIRARCERLELMARLSRPTDEAFFDVVRRAKSWAMGRSSGPPSFKHLSQLIGESEIAYDYLAAGREAAETDLARAKDIWAEGERRGRKAGDLSGALRNAAAYAEAELSSGQLGEAAARARRIVQEASQHHEAVGQSSAMLTLAAVALHDVEVGVLPPVAMIALSLVLVEELERSISRLGDTFPEVARHVLPPVDAGEVEGVLGRLALRYGAVARGCQAFADGGALAWDARRFDLAAVQMASFLRAANQLGDDAQRKKWGNIAAGHLHELLEEGRIGIEGHAAAAAGLGHHYAGSDSVQAVVLLREAVTVVEDGAPEIARGKLRDDFSDAYRLLSTLLRRSGSSADAFDALRLIKGRRLYDEIAASIGAVDTSAPPGALAIQAWLADRDVHGSTVMVDLVLEQGGVAAHLLWSDGCASVSVDGISLPAIVSVEGGEASERAGRLIEVCKQDPLLSELVARVRACATEAVGDDPSFVLAPDGVLHNLPLHLVPVEGTPWCDLDRISLIPSVTVAPAMWRTRPRGGAVVFGDSSSTQSLPGAAEECRAVAELYGAAGLVGPSECTRAAFVEALGSGEHDLVHIAVHGRADPRNGDRSSLLIGERDWMSFQDLAGLPWSSRLVVLSGCSTAVSGPREGRDLVDVARAAAHAGAATVIASLWPVRDDVARDVMVAFHEWWAPRRDNCVDLRAGLESAISTVRTRAPVRDSDNTRRRDGRQLSLAPPSGSLQPKWSSGDDAIDWASFVIIGDPFAGMADSLSTL